MNNEATTSVVTITLLLAALGLKLTDLVKFISNAIGGKDGETKARAVNDLATFFLGWAIGIGAAWVLAHTAWGDEVSIGKETLSNLDLANLVVFGLVFNTVAATLYDFKKAIDQNDSANKDPLIPNTPQEPARPLER
jgi:hypothetical protein